MALSLTERLTIQFYEWEKRGRGWYIFEAPVHLEPEFVPFFGHKISQTAFVDDALRKNIFQKAFELIQSNKPIEKEDDMAEYANVIAYPFTDESSMTAFRLTIPKNYSFTLAQTMAMLVMLSSLELPVSFEIIGTHKNIHLQFTCRVVDASILRSQIKAFFPEVIVNENKIFLEDIMIGKGYGAGHTMDFGLKEEFMRTLESDNNFKIDPFTSLFGIFETLIEREQVSVQILFTKVKNPWSKSILRSVVDSKGGPFFLDAPEMVKLAEEKTASPLFAVNIRLITQANTEDESFSLLKQASYSLKICSSSPYNSIIPLETDLYNVENRIADIYRRESHRVGMLLNVRELANFVHFPNESIISTKLDRDIQKTHLAPIIIGKESILLGKNDHLGKSIEVRVRNVDRLKHTHIIGGTGTGKSTLLLQMIKQDIEAGRGLCVLDPHGDLIEAAISLVIDERLHDVLIIDPADGEYPVSFNILEAHSDIEKEILSSDLVGGFKRLSTSWGDQMNSVLANAILAFLESPQGGTLADLRRFLIEKEYRNAFLKTVSDPSIKYYWLKEFPLLKTNSIGSILTRLDTFLRPKVIRNMVAQRKGIDFETLINNNKIIFVKLSQGLIGVENSYLLGTFVVSKIHQAIMARQATEKEARNNFFLYIDEFQNFITPSMSAILSGARKYHLGLILAHQDMQQLVKTDSELASSVLANAGTRICFRLSDTDAKRLDEGFSHFEAIDLQNLGVGKAIARIERPDNDFNLDTINLDPNVKKDISKAIISASRHQFATPRQEVEALLMKSYEDIPIITSKEEVKVQEINLSKKRVTNITQDPEEIKQSVEVVDEELKDTIVKREIQTKHRYLQTLVKRMAESRGYVSTIEKPLIFRKGSVDVSLEREGKKIAVEICVSTRTQWELHNIQKCLDEGYDLVIECSTDKKMIEDIKREIYQTMPENDSSKIMVFEPEELFLFLEKSFSKEPITENRMKGYRVKVEYDDISTSEMIKKKDSVSKVILESFHKRKKKH